MSVSVIAYHVHLCYNIHGLAVNVVHVWLVGPVWDNFATFWTLISRAWSDLSDDSTESENVLHGRVTATAFTHAIASELRLKSDSRKMHYGVQTHAQADNCLQSADPSAKAHTSRGLRSKQVQTGTYMYGARVTHSLALTRTSRYHHSYG